MNCHDSPSSVSIRLISRTAISPVFNQPPRCDTEDRVQVDQRAEASDNLRRGAVESSPDGTTMAIATDINEYRSGGPGSERVVRLPPKARISARHGMARYPSAGYSRLRQILSRVTKQPPDPQRIGSGSEAAKVPMALLHSAHGRKLDHGEPIRIEGLCDAVFAFAVTLLIVSLEVPKT
jgi:hypothetical protein